MKASNFSRSALSLAVAICTCTFTFSSPAQQKKKPTSPSPQACVPNHRVECACLGGGTGVQVCMSDGMSYDTCTGCSSVLTTQPTPSPSYIPYPVPHPPTTHNPTAAFPPVATNSRLSAGIALFGFGAIASVAGTILITKGDLYQDNSLSTAGTTLAGVGGAMAFVGTILGTVGALRVVSFAMTPVRPSTRVALDWVGPTTFRFTW